MIIPAAAGIAGAGVLALVLISGMGDPTAGAGMAAGAACASTGPVHGLDAAAAANARVVAATAMARGGSPAAFAAILGGLAESGLHILANPNDPASLMFPHTGTGRNGLSSGIFQQQPWWGTPAQRMDPAGSTNLFLDALLKVSGWQNLTPWMAVQTVQQSAFPDGSNYLAQMPTATSIMASVGGATTQAALTCGGSGAGKVPSGPVGANGLPTAWKLRAGTSAPATAAVTSALSELGKPYVYGAAGPSSFDCSGLTQSAWRAGGKALRRVTTGQLMDGTATTQAQLLPGDLVLTPGSDGTLAAPGHMGMFIGSGLVVAAPHTGDVVKVVTLASFISGGVSGLRHIA